jgi:UDP-glucose 4-epimerase
MKSLVTGGAGFIGSHLVDKLIDLGHDVIVIDNESSGRNYYWNDKADNHLKDICNYAEVRELYEGVDNVFHVAARSRIGMSFSIPKEYTRVNLIGTAVSLQCSVESGVKKFIYSSSSSVYGNNVVPNVETQTPDLLNPYSFSKFEGEKLCKSYFEHHGLDTIVLRYFNVYGDRQPEEGALATVLGIFNKMRKDNKKITVYGDGSKKRDFTHVSDIINANILAATQDIKTYGETFNIGASDSHSIKEIAEMFSSNIEYKEDRLGEALETRADINKAKSILGWEPKIKIKEWIKNDIMVNDIDKEVIK